MVYIMNNLKQKEKKWVLKSCDDSNSEHEISKIATGLNIHAIIAKLLYNRGYTDVKSAKNFT